MPNMITERRFIRFLMDLEVEVVDPTAAAAYTMDWGRDESGEPVMMPYSNQADQIRASVSQLLGQTLANEGARAGVKPLGASLLLRHLSEDGQTYLPVTLPSMPARNDDGSLPPLDEWPPLDA